MRGKGPGGQLLDAVTLHKAKYIVPVYTEETLEVHPHAENV